MRCIVAAALALACAGAPPPPEPKPAPRVTPASRSAPEERADLSPVARPDHVIAVARVKAPGAFYEQLSSWRMSSRFPELVDARVRGLGEHVAPDAPMDLVLAVERAPAGPAPEPLMAISAGLDSLANARSELTERGVALGRGGRGIVTIEDAGPEPCVLAPSRGVTSGRLVCATSERALAELLPYVTRGLAAEAPPAEAARLEVDVARFRALHGKRLEDLKRWVLPFARAGVADAEPRLGAGLAPLLDTLYDETLAVLGDVDRVELTAELEPSHVDLMARATFGRDPRSFFLQTLFESATRQAPPPPDFWKLPADAHFAFFSHGMPASRAKTLEKTLSGVLSRAARTPTPGATFDLVIDALFPSSPFVYAFGLLDPPVELRPSYASRIRTRTERVLGWHVVGVEIDPKALEKRLDRGMYDYNKGALRNLVYGEFPSLCPGLPKISRRPAPRKGGLPAGSVLYEMVVPGKLFEDCAARHGLRSAKPPTPLGIAVVFVPGKPRSWLVISPNTEFALGKMRELLGSSTEQRLVAGNAGPDLTQPSLFGAVVSEELISASNVELVMPARSRSSAVVAMEARRVLAIRARKASPSLP